MEIDWKAAAKEAAQIVHGAQTHKTEVTDTLAGHWAGRIVGAAVVKAPHEMRLVSIPDVGVKPYCICGWVGRRMADDEATEQFREHAVTTMTDWMVGRGHMVRFPSGDDPESGERFDEFSLLVTSRVWTSDEGTASYALVPLAEAMELRRSRRRDVCGEEWRITRNVSTVCGQAPGHSSAHCGPVMWRDAAVAKEDN